MNGIALPRGWHGTAAGASVKRGLLPAGLPPFVRDPLGMFILLGAGFFLLYWVFVGRAEKIEVTASAQAALVADFTTMTGRAPTAQDRQKLIDDYVSEEVLFHEAIQRGIHLTDKTIKERMIDRLRFMIAGVQAEPTNEQLVNFYADHLSLYRAEPKISLDHVFFTRMPVDAPAILQQLQVGQAVKGDDFWMGRSLPDYGESMLRGMFGDGFLCAVKAAPVGSWVGPLRSARGVHFVRVAARSGAAMMPFETVRDQVRQDFMADDGRAKIDAEVSKLEKKYDVQIDR